MRKTGPPGLPVLPSPWPEPCPPASLAAPEVTNTFKRSCKPLVVRAQSSKCYLAEVLRKMTTWVNILCIYIYMIMYIYNMLFSCMKGVVGYCIILGTLVSCKPMLLSNWVSHVWRKVGAGWLSRHAVWEKHRNTWGPKMADPTTIDFYPLNNIKHYSFWMVQWFMVLVYSHLPIAMTWRKSLGGVLFDFPGFMTCSGAKVNWAARFGGANSCGGRVFQGVLGLWVFKAEDSRKPISAIGGLFQSSTLSILGTNYLDLFGLWYISKR